MTPAVRRGRGLSGWVAQPKKPPMSQQGWRQWQCDGSTSCPSEPPISDAYASVTPHQFRVSEAEIDPLKMRRRVEPRIDRWLEPGKSVVHGSSSMQMRV